MISVSGLSKDAVTSDVTVVKDHLERIWNEAVVTCGISVLFLDRLRKTTKDISIVASGLRLQFEC